MDDLRAQISMKNLQEGGSQSPLLEFKGVLDGYDPEVDQRFGGVRVKLRFSNLEVIRSTQPYHFPLAELAIRHSNQKKSGWGVLSTSAEQFFQSPEDDLPILVGKRIHMSRTGGHMMWNRDKGAEEPREAWEILGVEGLSSSNGSTPAQAGAKPDTALSAAIKLLNGKTIQEFNQEALRNSTVKSDPGLVSQILGGQFATALEQNGTVSKDAAGKYVVSESALAAVS